MNKQYLTKKIKIMITIFFTTIEQIVTGVIVSFVFLFLAFCAIIAVLIGAGTQIFQKVRNYLFP